jgi:hypothetical protein
MQRSFFFRAVALTAIALIATSAQADRRTSLAGNDLLEDGDDVFLFPQTLQRYQNRMTLDFGPASGAGNGIFSLGNDNMTFGAAIHRDPSQQGTIGWQDRNRELLSLGGFGLQLTDSAFQAPLENFDILFGMRLSDALAIGARIGLGRGLSYTDNQIPKEEAQPPETRRKLDSNTQSDFHLTLGGSLKSDGMKLDGSLAIKALSGTKLVDNDSARDASTTVIGIATRAFINMSEGVDLGAMLGLNFATGWVIDSTGEDPVTSTNNGLDFLLGVGPKVQIDNGPLVAAYAVLKYTSVTADPDTHADANDDSTIRTKVVLPGIRMAGEYRLKPWMVARAGMDYSFATNTTDTFVTSNWSADGTPRGLNNLSQDNEADFGWNAGLGFNFGKLNLDATLNHGSLYFLWQNAPFALISATYNFGKASGGGRARVRRAAPAPMMAEPEPEPKPAEPAPSQNDDDDF